MPAPLQSEGCRPTPLENPLNRPRQGPMLPMPGTSNVTDMVAQALMDGDEMDPMNMSADQQMELMVKAHNRERRKQMQMSSGVRAAQPRSKSKTPTASDARAAEIHEIHTSEEEGTPKFAIQDFQMVRP